MANLNWDSLVGDKTIVAGGYVGDLLSVAILHLNEARNRGQLTDAMVGEVYASTISNAFQTALSFVENDELSKAKVVTELKQHAILDANLADIERGIALKEAQATGIAQDNLVKEQSVLKSKFEVDNLLPKELAKITAEVADISRGSAVKEAQIKSIADDIHGKEWDRSLAALKMQVDAEVALYSSKRLDTAPAFITKETHTGTEDSATIAYDKLVGEIPTA